MNKRINIIMKLVSLLLLFCGLLPLFTSALVDEEIANEEMSASSPQQRKLVVEQITDTTDTSLPLANHHQNQQQESQEERDLQRAGIRSYGYSKSLENNGNDTID